MHALVLSRRPSVHGCLTASKIHLWLQKQILKLGLT